MNGLDAVSGAPFHGFAIIDLIKLPLFFNKILVEGLNIVTQAINNEKQDFALAISGGL